MHPYSLMLQQQQGTYSVSLHVNAPFVLLPTLCVFAKRFHSERSPGCFLANFRQALIFLPSEMWILLLVHIQEFHFSPDSSWWWTHKCRPKPRTVKSADCWMLKLGFFLPSCMVFILCSWGGFGRTTTSWKIHCCPTVSPSVRHVVGWDSVEPWSFRNDFGSISRLTGVNIIPPEILRNCVWSWRWHGFQTCVLTASLLW